MKGSVAVRLGLAIAGVLLIGAAAGAQAPMDGGAGIGLWGHRPPFERAFGAQGDHGRWWNNPKVVERLKLTDEQRKSMDDTLLEHRETLIDLRASLEKAELGLEPLMKDDQPNEARILAADRQGGAGAGGTRKGECAVPAGDSQQADAGAVEAVAGRTRSPWARRPRRLGTRWPGPRRAGPGRMEDGAVRDRAGSTVIGCLHLRRLRKAQLRRRQDRQSMVDESGIDGCAGDA